MMTCHRDAMDNDAMDVAMDDAMDDAMDHAADVAMDDAMGVDAVNISKRNSAEQGRRP